MGSAKRRPQQRLHKETAQKVCSGLHEMSKKAKVQERMTKNRKLKILQTLLTQHIYPLSPRSS